MIHSSLSITLVVDDLEEVKRFYRSLLGFEIIDQHPDTLLLESPCDWDSRFCLLAKMASNISEKIVIGKQAGGNPLLHIAVKNYEVWQKDLIDSGIHYRLLNTEKMAIEDPFGNEIIFSDHTS